MKNNCVFCAIAAGEIPCFKIYEDETALAFLDINPFAEGHTLVVPKVHREGLLDAGDAELAELVAVVKKVAAAIKAELKCDGFNILQNNGEAAGQSVRHIHFHILGKDHRLQARPPADGFLEKLCAIGYKEACLLPLFPGRQ